MNKITWAPLIPLIGGFPVGSEQAIGYPPEAIYSYNGFLNNDSNYIYYQNTVLNNNLDYVILDEEFENKHIDIIVCTPPLSIAA